MNRITTLLGLLLLGLLALPARAQSAAAILMVEDGDNQLVEITGARLYQPFLQAGPYQRVVTIGGRSRANERLAAQIRRLAAEHEVVDLVLSVHTTTRTRDEMLRLVPPEARKLRLVYSTACYGAVEEREAWEALGARAVVTHVGINNPLVALPYFLSRWLAGDTVGAAVESGYRETQLVHALALSLPGLAENGGAMGELQEVVTGSRPVVSGDAALTIGSGLRFTPRCPPELRYSRDRGASFGLALRALAGRLGLRGAAIPGLLARMGVPLPVPGDQLGRVIESLAVEEFGGDRDWNRSDPAGLEAPRTPKDGRLVLRLREPLEVPLQDGFSLRLDRRVTLRAGGFDPASGVVQVWSDGIWVVKGPLLVALTGFRLAPGDAGWTLRASAAAWGLIPLLHSIPLGGSRPGPIADDGPIFQPISPAAGLVERIGRP